jgi:hypothetical protein
MGAPDTAAYYNTMVYFKPQDTPTTANTPLHGTDYMRDYPIFWESTN